LCNEKTDCLEYYILFAAYLIFFAWLVTKVKFFTASGLTSSQLVIIFLLKVMAGIFYGWIGVYYGEMAQMLDIGAEGLILPQVKTGEETRHIIQSVKYAPMGQRGVSISTTATLFRDYKIDEYMEWANRQLMTVVQIESEEGINNAGKIISTEGVDAIMIGPADLSHDMGISGQLHHPRMEEAFREVITQCNKYGVAPGIHLNNMEDVNKWVNEGMRFITYGYDSKFIKDAYKESLLHLRHNAGSHNKKSGQ